MSHDSKAFSGFSVADSRVTRVWQTQVFLSMKPGSGADTQIRTEDLLFTKQLLYH